MTTTYYPQPSPAPRPFDRAFGGREFGYDEPRAVMHDNFPAAMPQPAGPSKTPSALRSGVMLLGAVAAVGAGVLIGVTLFGKDGSTSTPIQPVYLVPGANGETAALPTPTSIAPAAPSSEGVVLPGTDAVILPSPNNGPVFNVPLPSGPNAAPPPVAAPAPNPLPAPIVVPVPVKTAPEPPKPAPPAPPKADPPKIDPKIEPPKPLPGPTGSVGPKGPGDTEVVLPEPPPVGPKGPGDTEVVLPKPGPKGPGDTEVVLPKLGPKGPGDTEVVLPKPVPAPPAPVPAPPEPTCDFFSC